MSLTDLNKNGVPDYKEGWFWRTAGKVAVAVVKVFVPKHTVAYKAAELYDDAVKQGITPEQLETLRKLLGTSK